MSILSFAMLSYILGLLLGFNPVLLSTFMSYINSLIGRRYKTGHINLAGFAFIAWFGLLVFVASILAAFIFSRVGNDYLIASVIAFGIIGVVIGVIQIRHYFWAEPIIKPPKDITILLHDKTTKKDSALNTSLVALLCAMVVIPTIGINIILLSLADIILGQTSYWMIMFTIGLITPIYGVLAMLGSGTKPSAIVSWKEKNKAAMRLYGGLTTIFIAWLTIYLVINKAGI